MPIHFWWKPNNSPVSSTANRVDLGLEIGGDDPSITRPTSGRIRLVEVPGTDPGGNQDVNEKPRLVATFHGTFHRNASAPPQTRLTFEILQQRGTIPPNSGDVIGFDPECILGVDALVLTVVNREFVMFLPFFVDARSEGDFLEFQAIAEIKSGNDFVPFGPPSALLKLGIRRIHVVETTTNINNVPSTYTGRVVGNLILHHEDYLVQGATRKTTDPPFAPNASAQIIPFALATPSTPSDIHVPFQPYVSGSLQVLLTEDILEDILPDDAFLISQFPGQKNSLPQFKQTLLQQARLAIQQSLVSIFTDAGFAGMAAPWESETAGRNLASAFTAVFVRRHGVWELRNAQRPFQTGFWNFIITLDSSMSPVGEGGLFTVGTLSNSGGRQFILSYPLPIGSGQKAMTEPGKVRSGFFGDKIRGRSYKSRDEFDSMLAAMSAKVAIVIAHEVAHNLGMMHTMRIENSGPYLEAAGSPVLTIMASSVESDSYGQDMRFSTQSKAIWARAFGTSPNFNDTTLVNKTWTTGEVATVDWFKRKKRFFDKNNEIGMTFPGLGTSLGQLPPFAKSPPGAQRGTFIPQP